MLHDRVALPVDVLAAVLRWEGVDQPHTMLSTTARWMDDNTRREADRKGLAELADQGLADDAGFRAAMRVLAHPAMECYGWTSDMTGSTGLLAVADDTQAVLAVRDDDTVWLRSIRPDSLVESVVGQLPAMAAAHGRSLNVPEIELTGRRAATDDEGFHGFDRPGPSTDARMLLALMAEPRIGTGQLHVAVRDGLGRRRRSPHALGYVDIGAGRPGHGRWMTQLTSNWVYAAPATPQSLAAKLTEMRHRPH